MRRTIEVAYSREAHDVTGQHLARDIRELGFELHRASTRQLYQCQGDLPPAVLDRLGRDLLTDRVTQVFFTGTRRPPRGSWIADVWFKPGVTDVVAESVSLAAASMGLRGPIRVSTGTRVILQGRLQRSQVEQALTALLANPLIHDLVIRRVP